MASGRTRPSTALMVAIFVIAVGMLLYGWSSGISWAGLRPSPCYPTCFCEEFQRGTIAQPLSSYSNLWYLLVGLGVLVSTGITFPGDDQRTNLLLRNSSYITGYSIAVVSVGITSYFYHVSLTLVGRWTDYLGMYAFASLAVTYDLARLRLVHGRSFAVTYATLVFCLAIPMMAVADLNFKRALLLGLILVIIGLEGIIYLSRHTRHTRLIFFISALGALALATLVNLLDERGIWCNHASFWQWHAVWHFLTAFSIGLLFVYYRTEDDGEQLPVE
jgi:hypothetical protein